MSTNPTIPVGINKEVVKAISAIKKEPRWMLDFRLKALDIFEQKPMPKWGPDLSGLDFNKIQCYIGSTKHVSRRWQDVPNDIKQTYEKLGIPEVEQKYLAGVTAQYNSGTVYSHLKKQWEKDGVIFVDTDTAIQKHPDLVKRYISTVIKSDDNKFAALNSAVWSGGSFVYVPKNVHVDIPVQTCFHITKGGMGQFERTLIIADEGSYVNCIESCTAPRLTDVSIHAAVFEVIVKKGARVRCTAIQNWSDSVYNLVTKRIYVEEDGIGEWVSGNIGSKIIMAYPSIILAGSHARGDILSLTNSDGNHHKDTGGKVIHLARNTSSTVIAKSISMNGGRADYRGLSKFGHNSSGSRSFTRCDNLLIGKNSSACTYPTSVVSQKNVTIEHEASVNRIGEEQLFYLMSRGLTEQQAKSLIVNGFIEPITRELPMIYAKELNRLINHTMAGAVG